MGKNRVKNRSRLCPCRFCRIERDPQYLCRENSCQTYLRWVNQEKERMK